MLKFKESDYKCMKIVFSSITANYYTSGYQFKKAAKRELESSLNNHFQVPFMLGVFLCETRVDIN
jgi:hypothetical protein